MSRRKPPVSRETLIPQALRELFELAVESRLRAHAPYSGHRVGAAIRTRDGRLFGGCNVENSSYGATTCAEQVAIHNAVVSSPQKPEISEVYVVTDADPAWPPCGICRQVLAEFGTPQTRVFAGDTEGKSRLLLLADLLPEAFTPEHLAPARKGKRTQKSKRDF